MARRKRSNRSRTTAQRDNLANQTREESIEEAHARMAREAVDADPGPEDAPPISDEEIEAELAGSEFMDEEEALIDAELAAEEVPSQDPDLDVAGDPDPYAFLPPVPEIDWSLFERGPLAAGIQILEALLEEAKGGYIAAGIERLEDVLGESFDWGDRAILTQVASGARNSSGLPDVAAAYRAVVAHRATEVS